MAEPAIARDKAVIALSKDAKPTLAKAKAIIKRDLPGFTENRIKTLAQSAMRIVKADTPRYVELREDILVKAKRKTAKRNPRKKRTFTPAQRRAQKLFAQRARSGALRKKAKRKTVKEAARKNPVKRKTKTAVHARPRKNPAPRKGKAKAFGRRDRVIRAHYRTKDGYKFYYLAGDAWRGRKADATRYSQANGVARIKAIRDRLEPEIEMVTLERV